MCIFNLGKIVLYLVYNRAHRCIENYEINIKC